MSLRQVYKDLAFLLLFFGLILTCVLTIYGYFAYQETYYALLAFASGLMVAIIGVAEFVFRVEIWRTIIEYWRRRKEKGN